MIRRLALLLVALLAALVLPATVLAADADEGDGFIFKVDGMVTIDASEHVDSVILINGNAVVDGIVDNTLWVVNGNATINGRVDGDVMVFNGVLTLNPSATVKNVSVVRGDLNRAPGATVTGEIHERSAFVSFGWGSAVFSFVFWFGTTLPLIGIGLLFAAIAGRQLTNGGALLADRPGASVVAAVLLWMGIPLLATLAILTLIGIPLGILALLALPVLWVAGYVVAATRLGLALVRRTRFEINPDHPYLAAAAGVLVFQLIGLVPFIGGLVVGVAGLVGSGALATLTFDARRARKATNATQVRQEPLPAA